MKTFITVFLLFSISVYAQPIPSRPNIIIVIGDDMRFDSFDPNGGPDWFDDSNISRVAEEGANFKNYFCVFSLCIPSRSSMMTGLYPHSNGAYDNIGGYFPWLPTMGTMLHDAGYHTAMIGKYHAYFSPQPGWDYWMAKTGETDYINASFNVNGVKKTIPGYITQTINDSAYKIISAIDTPFLISIEHQVPHKPVVPLPEDVGIYSNEQMPFPSNFYPYQSLYPSFLDEKPHYTDSLPLIHDLESYFEGLQGIDRNMAQIFEVLTSRNILDNSIIIFTGDNGMMYGEHLQTGKGVPYEPSIRLPMFIRYPAWFAADTEINALGIHVDIVPTLLEAAGLDNSLYELQGLSLHKLATGEAKRDLLLYENIKMNLLNDEGEDAVTPTIRTVRSLRYKYNFYQCESLTEEFFDLQNDPEENINRINEPAYANRVHKYRFLLDSMRTAMHDTLSNDTLKKPCYLAPGKHSTLAYIIDNPITFKASPNPFEDQIELSVSTEKDGDILITMFDELGQLLISRQVSSSDDLFSITLDAGILRPGIYLIRVTQGAEMNSQLVFKN